MDPQQAIQLRSGRRMPALGLGTWQLTDDTEGTICAALEQGYRLFDTSGDYRTQRGIGKAIAKSGIDRTELFLVTKVEETDDSYAATQTNIRELGLDYANLMLIHRPPQEGAGEALWDGLMRAREDGLCVDIGISNYPRELIDRLIETSGEAPAVNQIEWSPFGYSVGMLDYLKEQDIVIQAYSPLTRTTRLYDETLLEIAGKYGKSPAQVLIRWNIQLGTVPLPKANRRQHLVENIEVWDFHIDEHDMRVLCSLNESYSALGTLPYT